MAASGEWEDDDQLATLEPEADGEYRVAPGSGDLGEPHEDRAEEFDNHRQLVCLEARALLRAR